MLIANSAATLNADLDMTRRQGGSRHCVSLVIAGDDLHAGHQALIRAARSLSDIVVVAITPNLIRNAANVVSASQFQDIALVDQADVDFLYTPADREVMHLQMPGVFSLRLPDGYPICGDTETIARALTLTLRFLNVVQPDVVVCGERNYVEYRLLRQLVSDLCIRAQIQCIPTVRDGDGLALSSSNGKLTETERSQAPILYQTLNNVAHAIRTGARNFDKLENTARIALKGAGFDINSFGVYDDDTLTQPSDETSAFRIIGSAHLGGHRLHDSLGLSL